MVHSISNFGPGANIAKASPPVRCGLLVSQLLTLYTTPVIYVMVEALRARIGATRQAAKD